MRSAAAAVRLPTRCLQHEQTALLNGELDVAHVAVVVLEELHHRQQLLVRLGELVAHRVERLGDADARNDVLALSIRQEVAVRLVLARRRVARERDAGARVVALVAEHHCLHVDCGAQVVRDALHLAVVACAPAVPRLEHRFDRVAQLFLRIRRELDACLGSHDLLERLDEAGEIFGAQLGVDAECLGLDEVVQGLFEQIAGDVEHDLAEHLDEPSVRVVRETLVLRLLREAFHGLVVETQVQNRVHHSGHRKRRAGPHGDQQRVGGVAERLAHLLLELLARDGHLRHEPGRQFVARRHVRLAGVGADREPRRDGEAEVRHLGEVGALATEQILLLLAALFERVHVFHGCFRSRPCGLRRAGLRFAAVFGISQPLNFRRQRRPSCARSGRACPACSRCASSR